MSLYFSITKKINGSALGDLPWYLISFASGISIYFALPIEPTLTAITITIGIGCTLAIILNGSQLTRTAFKLFAVAAMGFLIAFLRTQSLAAPRLSEQPQSYDVKLFVEEVQPLNRNRVRYIGRTLALSRHSEHNRPRRLQFSTTDQGVRFSVNDQICVKLVLRGPKGPTHPGGYNPARKLWFNQVGGSGFAISRPKLCYAKGGPAQLGNPLTTLIAMARETISSRIARQLGENERAIATALILGDRGKINENDKTAIRRAGLAHLLAISGLHMAMFAGTVFFVTRALLALNQTLALTRPIKKYAALCALLGGTLYFCISGQSIPTQRAYIMMVIFIIAILTDRPAITLRNISLAAFVILILRPESLLSPGFQMSFAAATALIAAYQYKLSKPGLDPINQSAFGKPLYYLLGIWLTSIIATLATAPFALFHFQQISILGPLGNMLAIPVFSFLVMPSAVLTLVAMPFGLDGIAMVPLEFSIELLLASAHWTAGFEPATWKSGTITNTALIFFVAAGLALCFAAKPPIRLIAVLLGLALYNLTPVRSPDIFINQSGSLFAVRGPDNKLHAPEGRRDNYSLKKWLDTQGDRRQPIDVRRSGVVSCDDEGCAANVKGMNIAFINKLSALPLECERADILITRFELARRCPRPKLILTRLSFFDSGAIAIFIESEKIAIRQAKKTGKRIWSAR